MSFIVRYTHEAEAGIESNYAWWAEHRSPKQALDWAEAVERQVNGLRETASQCSRSREDGREGFPFPLFDKFVGLGRGNSHRAVFTIREDIVFVLAVRSNRQDELTPDEIETDLDSI